MEELGDSGFDFADLVDEAVQRSGGETSTAEDILKVRRGMRLLTERWTAAGFNTWRINEMTIMANGPEVQLPNRVDDVIQVNAIRDGFISESIMRRIPPAEYMQLTDKQTRGLPSQYWFERSDPPKLHVFPIGGPGMEDRLVIYYVERPEAYERYGFESDVPGRWLEALVTGLALDLARKRPPYNEGLIARLKSEAMEAEELAQRADRDRARFRYRIG